MTNPDPTQEALDHHLIAFCGALPPDRATARVATDRGTAGRVTEPLDHHLFQHQVQHRGQAHAMLSSTTVKPPQLDDFLLDCGRDPADEPFFT